MNVLLSFLFILIAFLSNSLMDAIKFKNILSGTVGDFVWHILKWIICFPSFILYGIEISDSIKRYYQKLKEDFFWNIWHPFFEIRIILLQISIGVIIWNLFYFLI